MPEDESSSERCLHCEVNELVREHIERKDVVNLPELVAKMGESLVELILLGPEEQWGNLGGRCGTRCAHRRSQDGND